MRRIKIFASVLIGITAVAASSLTSPSQARNDNNKALNQLAIQMYMQNMASQQQAQIVAQQQAQLAAQQQAAALQARALQQQSWQQQHSFWGYAKPTYASPWTRAERFLSRGEHHIEHSAWNHDGWRR